MGREFHDGSISTHVGWQHRDDHSDEHVQVKLLGQSRELEIDTRVGSNFYVGGEAQFKVAGGLLLALTGEAVFGSQRYRNVQGVISLSRPF